MTDDNIERLREEGHDLNGVIHDWSQCNMCLREQIVLAIDRAGEREKNYRRVLWILADKYGGPSRTIRIPQGDTERLGRQHILEEWNDPETKECVVRASLKK